MTRIMINLFRCIPLILLTLAWPTAAETPNEVITRTELRLGTLNIAHGRGAAWNQLLVGGKKIRRNLEAAGDHLGGMGLDVLALQEVDAPSRWSGKLDQPALLAEHAGFDHVLFGSHAQSFLFDYGTALLSRHRFVRTHIQTFAPSPPTPDKGFVFGVLAWNPGEALPAAMEIGLVSLHLDFSRQSVRRSQLLELIDFLQSTSMPVILLGDFNLDAGTADAELEILAARLDLQLYEPEAEDQVSYPGRKNARLDWILLPRSLRFIRHETDEAALSDHRLVWADIALAHPGARVQTAGDGDSSP